MIVSGINQVTQRNDKGQEFCGLADKMGLGELEAILGELLSPSLQARR